VPVDDPDPNQAPVLPSESFIQFIVPPGNSPSYVNIKFTGYLAQRQVADLPPADKALLGFVVQTKEADPITGDPVWPVAPSEDAATPHQGNMTTVYQRAYTNLQALANPWVAEMSGQVVNCEWTVDMTANANEEVRVYIVTKSDDEDVTDVRNFIWLWGKCPLGFDGGNTDLTGYEDIDPGDEPVGWNLRPENSPTNAYPPITMSASQPPSNVSVIV